MGADKTKKVRKNVTASVTQTVITYTVLRFLILVTMMIREEITPKNHSGKTTYHIIVSSGLKKVAQSQCIFQITPLIKEEHLYRQSILPYTQNKI